MLSSAEFEGISPYSDAEAVEALGQVANHPMVFLISEYLFPNEKVTYLRDALKSVTSIDEFQSLIMTKAVSWVIDNTMEHFTYSGIENIKALGGKPYLAMSNHRDIILDPALTQSVLHSNGLPMTEICVGDNLIKQSKTVEKLLRSNRMIKVIRGISARELYLSSKLLSEYIRETITSGKAAVWLAQRQGRTKDGLDSTEQGLLKMLDMSGPGSFEENFWQLRIIPLSISYEYEPCDIRKAREILISRSRPYVKKRMEDMHSIVIGIRQWKGNCHLNIGKPLEMSEIAQASGQGKNERYQTLRHLIDRRVIEGFKLWKTNFIACDLVRGDGRYAGRYSAEDVRLFNDYTAHRLAKVERRLDKAELQDIFLRIYANPVISREKLSGEASIAEETPA